MNFCRCWRCKNADFVFVYPFRFEMYILHTNNESSSSSSSALLSTSAAAVESTSGFLLLLQEMWQCAGRRNIEKSHAKDTRGMNRNSELTKTDCRAFNSTFYTLFSPFRHPQPKFQNPWHDNERDESIWYPTNILHARTDGLGRVGDHNVSVPKWFFAISSQQNLVELVVGLRRSEQCRTIILPLGTEQMTCCDIVKFPA